MHAAAPECPQTPTKRREAFRTSNKTTARRESPPRTARRPDRMVGIDDATIQAAHPITGAHTRTQTIQDPHHRNEQLLTDRQTSSKLVRETAATCTTTTAPKKRHGGNEELRSTRSFRRRRSESGGILRTAVMHQKLTTLSLGMLLCWWSNLSGSANNAVLGATVPVSFGGGCPSACSGHGYCTNPSTETCSCHQGWAGGDCSIRE